MYEIPKDEMLKEIQAQYDKWVKYGVASGLTKEHTSELVAKKMLEYVTRHPNGTQKGMINHVDTMLVQYCSNLKQQPKQKDAETPGVINPS